MAALRREGFYNSAVPNRDGVLKVDPMLFKIEAAPVFVPLKYIDIVCTVKLEMESGFQVGLYLVLPLRQKRFFKCIHSPHPR